ncbi:MAG: hypothetical protein JW768_01755 [Chitinispirillaceae bacterium]|nr:hypothetical protein [Chitinispirillaceae bacterium]
MTSADPIVIVAKLARVLESHSIPYVVGGSLASSLHGIPRATQDVDVVVDLKEHQVDPVAEALDNDFFFDREMARDAIRRRSSFNIIDKEEFFKIDLFIQKNDEVSEEELSRRKLHAIADVQGQSIYLCSPEDIIAHKLYWYKLGDGVSERQWSDALNVIKVQNQRLDIDYLTRVCAARGVSDLLRKALDSVSGGSA